MRLAEVLGTGVTSWRDVHEALVPHNKAGEAKIAGFLFEEFAYGYFKAAPEYRGSLKRVWRERNVPRPVRQRLDLAKRDHGVDLVLEDKEGRLLTVQVKFKTKEHQRLGWTKDSLSSWLAESDEADGLVLFTNASGLDKDTARKAAKKGFHLVSLADLNRLEPRIISDILRVARGQKPAPREFFDPKPHQEAAIRDVVKGFKKHDRGQMILPCGAGKTFSALRIKQELRSKRTLVLVPSLALVSQIMRDWAEQQRKHIPYVAVCSENDIDKDKSDAILTHVFDVPGHVTTDPDEIEEFVEGRKEIIVYSTYQSLEAVADAGVEFDLTICDEAHKTATSKTSEFALVHSDALKTAKRLYMTATPRVLAARTKTKLGDDAFDLVADMSDEETFGREFHRMTFTDAIEQDVLVDYKIIIVGVSDREAWEHIQSRTYLEDADAYQVATSLAIAKVMRKHKLTHGLTFHSNLKRAKAFTGIHEKRTRGVTVEHVNGSMSTNERARLLREFRQAPKAVLTNARCLTEGVDVPAIDCVAFVDPKHSRVDIVQAAGRALRLPPDGKEKPYGVILIPVFYREDEDVEEISSSGIFKNVYEVVRAMADQDERLQAEIVNIKLGEGEKPVVNPRVIIDTGDDRLILVGFEEQLKAALVERVVARSVDNWEVRFKELKRFKEEHGDCLVPDKHVLSNWVGTQRADYKHGRLNQKRIVLLEELGFVWRVNEWKWENEYEAVKTYCEEHGPLLETRGHPQGKWINVQRNFYREGRLPQERIDLLNEIGFVWNVNDHLWEESFQKYQEDPPSMILWERNQRSKCKNGKLSKDREERLESIGFVWDAVTAQWESNYKELEKFVEECGHSLVPDASALGKWCGWQRRCQKRVELSPEREKRLNALGFVWDPQAAIWEKLFDQLAAFIKETGLTSPRRGIEDKKLFTWVQTQRREYTEDIISADRIARLEAIGFVWRPQDAKWLDLLARTKLAATDGKYTKDVLSWIHRQRSANNKGELSEERIALLEPVGVLDPDWRKPREDGRGADHPLAKLTEADVKKIYKDKRKLREIAEEYEISEALVSNIRNGKTWTHVTGHNAA